MSIPVNIDNLSFAQGYEQFACPPCRDMIGKRYRIDHLTSEKGRALNGKTCRVAGFTANCTNNPDARLQCVVVDREGDGASGTTSKPVLLKGCNLVPLEANVMRSLMAESAPLSDAEIMKGLRQGLAEHRGALDRKDLKHRVFLYKKLLKKLEAAQKSKSGKGNALEDREYCFPCGATYAHGAHHEFDNVFDWIMSIGRPACVGNNQIDMRRMDLGLKGDGVAACGICQETLGGSDATNNIAHVTLPCVHMFHDACLQRWLQSDLGRTHWNCPTCRRVVPHNMATYRVRYEDQLRNRFREFLLSGFCPKCILWVMEKDPDRPLPATNESGERMTIGCVGQGQEKVYAFPPPAP